MSAQCDYQLKMYDSFGDGWNGGILTIISGSDTYQFTLPNIPFGNAFSDSAFFTVTNGQPLLVNWAPGGFNNEVSFEIFDSQGNLVLEATAPASGLLLATTGSCPSCGKPRDFVVENVWDNRARLSWKAGSIGAQEGWRLIFGPKGFVPGPGVGDTVFAPFPKLTLTGLQKKTEYDATCSRNVEATISAIWQAPYLSKPICRTTWASAPCILPSALATSAAARSWS